MSILVNTFFESRVEQLFDLGSLVEQVFSAAGLEYRIVGGFAVYLYVEEKDPDAGRLTRDIDIAVRREDVEKIAAAALPFGLEHRHVSGVDMLVSASRPSARRAVHFVFTGEKVRPEYLELTPNLGPGRMIRGLRLVALTDLIRMQLTSFRAQDEAHLKDLDNAGMITPDIEISLPAELSRHLAQVRARE